jgi:TorA maturation chaperone TorD
MRSGCITISPAETMAKSYGALAEVFSAHPTPKSVGTLCDMAEGLGIACCNAFPRDEIEREYMEIFVPTPRCGAPYESVYHDGRLLSEGEHRSNPDKANRMGRRLLAEDPTTSRPCSLEAGVPTDGDLPEHVGESLRFLAYTLEREAESSAEEARAWAELRGASPQVSLLKRIVRLRGKVAGRGRLGFYRVVLQVAEAVLRDDVKRARESDPPRTPREPETSLAGVFVASARRMSVPSTEDAGCVLVQW